MDESSEGFNTASLKNPEIGKFWEKLVKQDLESLSKGAEIRDILQKWAILASDQEKKANIETLTGLFSRAAFNEFFPRIIDVTQKANRPLGVLMVDVDFFKKFNDAYGHDVGDDVLKLVGTVTKDSIRQSDHPARYGGEEFVILLPGAFEGGVNFVAERLRKNIEDKELTFNNKEGKAEKIHITASIGATSFVPGDTPESFLKRADSALYQAKEQGRNRVVFQTKEVKNE